MVYLWSSKKEQAGKSFKVHMIPDVSTGQTLCGKPIPKSANESLQAPKKGTPCQACIKAAK